MVEPTLRVTAVPTRIFASEKINVIPARAELQVDCRVPPGMDGEATMRADARARVGDDGLEIEFMEQVVGNRSPIDTPLMDAIRDWLGENEPRRRGGPRACSRPSPTRAGSAPRSPTARPTASSRSATRTSTRPGR